jgi:hypothetical protein
LTTVGFEGTVLTSPDGVNWTGRSSGSTERLLGVAYGNSQFVAVGTNGTILLSEEPIVVPAIGLVAGAILVLLLGFAIWCFRLKPSLFPR